MKRYEMIKDKKVFNNIIKNGKYQNSKYFCIYYVKSNNNFPLFGIAVKNSYGKAHIRNYLKRQTRSIIDNNKFLFKNGYNYIIMIKRACIDGKFYKMEESMHQILEEINEKAN